MCGRGGGKGLTAGMGTDGMRGRGRELFLFPLLLAPPSWKGPVGCTVVDGCGGDASWCGEDADAHVNVCVLLGRACREPKAKGPRAGTTSTTATSSCNVS